MRVYCIYCPSEKPLWKSGKRKSRRRHGKVKQQYKCQDCHRQTVAPKKTRRRR